MFSAVLGLLVTHIGEEQLSALLVRLRTDHPPGVG
jgi:hypothetical protein